MKKELILLIVWLFLFVLIAMPMFAISLGISVVLFKALAFSPKQENSESKSVET